MDSQLKDLAPFVGPSIEGGGWFAEIIEQLSAVSTSAILLGVLQEGEMLQIKAVGGAATGLLPGVAWPTDAVSSALGSEVLRGEALEGHPVAGLFSDMGLFISIPIKAVSAGGLLGFLWVWEAPGGLLSAAHLPLLQMGGRQVALELYRKQASIALCRADEARRYLEQHLDGGSWACHLSTGQVTCSEQAEQILGREAGNGEGLPWKELLGYFNVQDRTTLWKQGQAAMRQEAEVGFLVRLATEADTETTVRIWGEPVYEQGVLVRYEGLIQRLNNPDRDRLSATGVGHELRGGLHTLKELAGLLAHENLSDIQKDQVQLLHLAAQYLATLLDYTLEPTAVMPRDLPSSQRTFNVRELLNEVHRSLEVNAQGKRLDFDLVVEQDIPEYMVGDPQCLGYILKNLVLNAFLFTQKGYVKILVDVLYQSDRELVLEFTVVDSGVGISDDGQLFFEMLPADGLPRNSPIKARMMGLGLTNRLVGILGGALHVNSTPYEGTEFYFKLKFGKATLEKVERLRERSS